MFRNEYEKLLSPTDYEPIAEGCYEILEYVCGLLENGADASSLRPGDERVAYHSHCQQRTLGLGTYTTTILERLGYDVKTSAVDCCGMAGSFGYKREYYELSMEVGERLQAQFTTPDTRDRLAVASGTSCHEQLDVLLEQRPMHPVQLVDPSK